MKKVALTGGIGSGKSLVAQLLREKGYKVLDADLITQSLYKEKGVREKILGIFGSLDRKRIAGQTFSDTGKRKKLESLLHPLVREAVMKKLKELRDERIVFVEVPLLFEAGFERGFDSVIVVSASRETRIRRLMERALSREECLQRMKAQLTDRERVKKADFVIDNNGTIQETRKQLGILLKKLGG